MLVWNKELQQTLKNYKTSTGQFVDNSQYISDYEAGKLNGISDHINNLSYMDSLEEQIDYCDRLIPPFAFRKIINLLATSEYAILCGMSADVGLGCGNNEKDMYRFYKGFKILSPYMSYDSSLSWLKNKVYKTML